MAAAGPAVGLAIALEVEGILGVIGDIRRTADQFDNLSGSVQQANDAVRDLRSQLSTGAAPGQFGALAAQFGTIGLQMDQLPQIAHDFRERLFRDPITMGAFGRSMVPARLGGPQDETRVLRDAIRMLRETTDQEKRLYLARRLGLETLLPLADLEEREFRDLEKAGELRGQLIDDDLRRLRASREAFRTRFELAEDRMRIERERVADPVFRQFEEMRARDAENRASGGLIGRLLRRIGRAPGESEQKAGEHTDAIRDNTQALRTLNKQYANGGPRAAGAIPAGLSGEALQRALDTHALRLGAFGL